MAVVVVGTGGGGRRNSLLRKDHMDNEEQLTWIRTDEELLATLLCHHSISLQVHFV